MSDPSTDPTPPTAGEKVIAGYVDCPLCYPKLMAAPVLTTKKGRYYLKCPVHDTNLMTNAASQHWITEHMRDTPQRQAGDPAPEPAPAPKPKPEPKKKRGAIEDW